MSGQQSEKLSLDGLKEIVRSAAGLRLRAELNATGGDGDKVFPPTYAGGIYAVEDRRIDGKAVRCVLLDSVQSQANRMEDALLDAFLPAWRELDSEIDGTDEVVRSDLPVLAVHVENHGWVTSLTAPHRVHDAIIRDSEIAETVNGEPRRKVRFRESTIGREIVGARIHDATGFFRHCPTALVFGTWDSTAGEGLNSAKVPRAVVSEIIGVDITPGVRTASRIDPLGIRSSATVYKLKDHEDDWTLDKDEAAEDAKGQKKRFGDKGKPSDINHGNVTPDMPRFAQREIQDQNLNRLPDILETRPLELRHELTSGGGRIKSHTFSRSDDVRIRAGAVKPGGVTMAYALHTWTLSLTQLRRLRFPIGKSLGERTAPAGTPGKPVEQSARQALAVDRRNEAARTVLAALALYALVLQQENGYWLRSRCELVPAGLLLLEQIGGDGGLFSFGTAAEVREILDEAIEEAGRLGLEWSKRVTVLTPTEKLQRLVRHSDTQGPESEGEQEPENAGAAG